MKNLRTMSLLFSIYFILLAGTAGYNKWTKQFLPSNVHYAEIGGSCNKSKLDWLKENIQAIINMFKNKNGPHVNGEYKFAANGNSNYFQYQTQSSNGKLACMIMYLKTRYRDSEKPTYSELKGIARYYNDYWDIDNMCPYPQMQCIINHWIVSVIPYRGECWQRYGLDGPQVVPINNIWNTHEYYYKVLSKALDFYADISSERCPRMYVLNRGMILGCMDNKLPMADTIGCENRFEYAYGVFRNQSNPYSYNESSLVFTIRPWLAILEPDSRKRYTHREFTSVDWDKCMSDIDSSWRGCMPCGK